MGAPGPRRGFLYWVTVPSEESAKVRPALVVSADSRNRLASDVLVVPASTVRRPAPTHVLLRQGEGGVPRPSAPKCEQLTTLPRHLLSARALGPALAGARMRQVERAILWAIDVPVA